MLKRRSLIAAASAIGLASLGLLAAAPANATTIHNCPSGETCLWNDVNYETGTVAGNYRGFEYCIPVFGQWDYMNTAISVDNSVTSLYNNGTSESALLYEGALHTGDHIVLHTQQGDGNLGNQYGTQGHDDQFSSGFFEGELNSAQCN